MALTRSQQMSRVRVRDTGPEMSLRRALWGMGLRYRVHYRIGRIRPDIVFVGHRLAVFIDGCFWHGCPEHYVAPKANAGFWKDKLKQNVERDQRQTRVLQQEGWTVLRIWEHEIEANATRWGSRIREALAPTASLSTAGI